MTQTGAGTQWLQQIGKGGDKTKLSAPEEYNEGQVLTWLREYGVEHSVVVDLPMDRIDTQRSRSNQARSEALISESVDRYVASLKEGAIFPPIVVYPAGPNKVVIIDGNNRHEAFRKTGKLTIPAIVVSEETTSETIQLMTVSANAHHGVTPTLTWRRVQAAYLMDLGYTAPDAAKATALTVKQLTDYRRLVKFRERARALRLRDFDQLPDVTQIRLGVLSLDNVFYQAASFVSSAKLSGDDVAALVRDIKAARTEGEQLQVIEKTIEGRKLQDSQRTAIGRKRSLQAGRMGLIMALGKVLKVDPAAIARTTLTDTERVELTQRCEKAAEILLDLSTLLSKEVASDARRAQVS